jgi:exopolysaccharide biosynthesis protein
MHTNAFARTRILVFILCCLCILVSHSLAQNYKTVHDGVEYAQVDHKLGSDPVKINLLRLDPAKVRVDVQHAMDAAIGTEKTSSIAARHGAVAAINAGFFRLDTSIFAGDAAGTLMIDGQLLSESRDSRSALLINNAGPVTRFKMDGLDLWANFHMGPYVYPLNGINRERRNNELVAYTPEFGRSTLTSGGTEYILRRGRIVKINLHGSSLIPADGFVLSAGDNWKGDPFRRLRVGRSGRLVQRRGLGRDADGFRAEDITNGVSQLVRSQKIHLTWENERSNKAFADTRHPRTAVATMKDGTFLMATIDGRQPGVSVGMTLQELAEYLLSLGAVDAMNLDGGGSTTMYLDGKVVNTPSDREGERKVGDAIIVTLRKKGAASRK